MKKGTTQLSKFKLLAKRLQLPDWQVVGLLESLWMFAQSESPAGDIGTRTDEAIAIQIGVEASEWRRFRDAMIAEGWLDPDSRCRFVIHDFEDHAPSWTKKLLERAGMTFIVADGGGPFASFRPPSSANGSQIPPVSNHGRTTGNHGSPSYPSLSSPIPSSPSLTQPIPASPAAAPPLRSPPPTPKNQTGVWNGEIRADQRKAILAVWNSTPGHRASDHDLRCFAQACSAVERWEDGPPEAKANPPDWLIARAERFMASDQARKGNGECKGPLRKWFTDDRWMRSEEQEQDRTVSVPVEDLAEITLRKMGLA